MSQPKPSLSDLRIDDHARYGGSGRMGLGLLVLVLAAVAGAALWYWFRAPRAVPVRVAAVVETGANPGGGGPAVLNASGYVTARRRATVSSKMTGKVVEVLVEEGMAVKAGQVLARLDDTTLRRYLELAEAELRRIAADGRRNRGAAQGGPPDARSRTRARCATAFPARRISTAPRRRWTRSKARLELTREQVTVAERQVAVRRTDLDDTVIRAPFSGVALSKDAQPGEMVSPVSAGGGFTRTGISTIVDMSSLEIEVDVNESFINRVTPGQKVEATLDAYPDWRIPAHVITIVPTADRQKATVLVRIGFEKLDPRILPDMGVKVAFLGAPEPASRRLPARASRCRGPPSERTRASPSCSSSSRIASSAAPCGSATPGATRSRS